MSKLLAFTVAKSQGAGVRREGVYDSETQLWQAEGETTARWQRPYYCTPTLADLECLRINNNTCFTDEAWGGTADGQQCDR